MGLDQLELNMQYERLYFVGHEIENASGKLIAMYRTGYLHFQGRWKKSQTANRTQAPLLCSCTCDHSTTENVNIQICCLIKNPLFPGYGMTESSPVTLMTPYTYPYSKVGSVGQLVPSTQARVVSLTTGEMLGPHKSGELWLRGPQVSIVTVTHNFLSYIRLSPDVSLAVAIFHTFPYFLWSIPIPSCFFV